MRIKNSLLLIAISASLAACADDLDTNFEVEEPLAETRVEGLGTASVLPSSFAPAALDIKATDAYKDEDFGFLTAIQIKEITLEITPNSEGATDTLEDGMADDFSFISELSINVVATLGGERQTALVGTLPMNDPMFDSPNRRLKLNVTKVNILPFVEASGYSLEVSAQGEPPPDDVIFIATVVYDVGFGNR
ncbi:MAG: hypothetical protein V3U65_14840 [Granulosicoccaceae bacterium]